MPEGHTIHRLARAHTVLLVGREVHATSPQGRFADGAQMLSGRVVQRVQPYGKHLFYGFDGDVLLHVHLGLYGAFTTGTGPAPTPRGALRLRMTADDAWIDLRGPTACELMTPPERDAVLARLGPDPLRRDAAPELAWDRLARTGRTVGELLMDQSVLAGVGNVFRAELLFVHGLHPELPANAVSREQWHEMWATLRGWLRYGVRSNRIVTVDPDEVGMPRSKMTREQATYVYKSEQCPRCDSEIRRWDIANRWAYACETCQPRPRRRRTTSTKRPSRQRSAS